MKPKDVSWSIYVRNGLGRRLAHLGEKIGSEDLIYNPMVMRHFHDDALRDSPRVIPAVLETFPEAQKFLDVGSGGGALSAELLRRGKVVVALERSPHGRALASKQGVDCRPFDLMEVPAAKADGPFDIVYCFEVAEHMPAELGDRLVEFMARYRTTILFSAAQPGQGGTGHINEQPDTYWIQRFERCGFLLDREFTKKLREGFVERGASQWFRDNPFVCRPI